MKKTFSTGEVLTEISGLQRDQLYYWVSKNYISPIETIKTIKNYTKLRFSNKTVYKIKLMYKYCEEDKLPPRVASEKADKELLKEPKLFL